MTAFSATWLSWLVQGALQAAVVGTFAILLASATGHRHGFGAWERGLLGIALVKFLLPPFWDLSLPSFVTILHPLARLHGAGGAVAGVALAPGIVMVHLVGALVVGFLVVRDGLSLKRALRQAQRVTGGPLWVELEGVSSELGRRSPRTWRSWSSRRRQV
jgi:hypothetical protein